MITDIIVWLMLACWSLIPSHQRDYVRDDHPAGQRHGEEPRPFNLGYQRRDQDAAHDSSDKDHCDPHKYVPFGRSLPTPGVHALILTAGSTGLRSRLPHGRSWLGDDWIMMQITVALNMLTVVATAFPELTPCQRVLAAGICWSLQQLYRVPLDK